MGGGTVLTFAPCEKQQCFPFLPHHHGHVPPAARALPAGSCCSCHKGGEGQRATFPPPLTRAEETQALGCARQCCKPFGCPWRSVGALPPRPWQQRAVYLGYEPHKGEHVFSPTDASTAMGRGSFTKLFLLQHWLSKRENPAPQSASEMVVEITKCSCPLSHSSLLTHIHLAFIRAINTSCILYK